MIGNGRKIGLLAQVKGKNADLLYAVEELLADEYMIDMTGHRWV